MAAWMRGEERERERERDREREIERKEGEFLFMSRQSSHAGMA